MDRIGSGVQVSGYSNFRFNNVATLGLRWEVTPGVGFFLGGDLRVEYLPWVLYHEIDWKNESLVWKYFDQLPWHV